MILGSNQPYFMPYIGYWQLINAVDTFEICDDFYYMKRKWINRNRIIINNESAYYNIEISHATSNKKINELYLANINKEKKLKQLQISYSRAPYYSEGIKLMEEIFDYSGNNLADFLTNSIKKVCDYLEISTKIIKSSEYEKNRELKKEFAIYDTCNILGADSYYNSIGGMKLYDFNEFKKRNIELAFIKTGDIEYKQFDNEFIPNLSIIDVIMFNSTDNIKKMLNNFDLITNSVIRGNNVNS